LAWTIEYADTAKGQLLKLDKQTARRILDFMEITPIRTEKDYRAALRVVSTLVDQDPSPDTPDGERLDVLSTLIEAYEQKHHAIDAPDKGGIDVKNLKDLKAELLANPTVRQAYDAQAPEFELTRELIAARKQAGLTQGATPP
jgi:hypothetical protein